MTTDSEVFGTTDARAAATDLLERGMLAAKAGDKDRARRLLLELTSVDPDNELAHVWLASVARGQEEALDHLRRAWQLNPARSEVIESLKTMLLRLGIAAAEAGDDARARTLLEECCAVDPTYDRGWLWLASVAGSPRAAMGHLRKVLGLDPRHPLATTTLERLLLHEGMEAAMAGDRPLATEYLTEASELNPANEQVWALLAQLAPDDDARLAALERALAVSPDSERLQETLAAVRSRREIGVDAPRVKVSVEAPETPAPAPAEKPKAEPATAVAPMIEQPNVEQPNVEQPKLEHPRPERPKATTPTVETIEPQSDAITTRAAAAAEAEAHVAAEAAAQAEAEAELAAALGAEVAVESAKKQAAQAAAVVDAPSQPARNPGTAPIAPVPSPKAPDAKAAPRSSAPDTVDRSTIDWPEADLVKPRPPITIVVSQGARRPAASEAPRIDPPAKVEPPATVEPPAKVEPVVETAAEPITVEAVLAAPEPPAVPDAPSAVRRITPRSAVTGVASPDVVLPQSLPPLEEALVEPIVEVAQAVAPSPAVSPAPDWPTAEESPPAPDDGATTAVRPKVTPLAVEAGWTLLPPVDEQPAGVERVVMVVDDSPTIRKAVSVGLEAEGYHVVTAVDGLDALRKLDDVRPDLILLDITMPGMDGYKLCRTVRSRSKMKAVPVVMLSGKDGFFDKVRGKMAGCTDYITKPFATKALLDTVAQHCGVPK